MNAVYADLVFPVERLGRPSKLIDHVGTGPEASTGQERSEIERWLVLSASSSYESDLFDGHEEEGWEAELILRGFRWRG